MRVLCIQFSLYIYCTISDQEESSSHTLTTLSKGLEILVQELQKKGTVNKELQNILQSVNLDNQERHKCDMLINIANTIFIEMEMRENVEKALVHSNSSLEELKNELNQKETQLFEVQSEVKRLEQIISENKIGK